MQSSQFSTKQFAQRLQALILDSGKSKAAIAKDLGLPSPSSLSKYTNASSEIKSHSLFQLASYFHVSADYLLGLTDVRTPRVTEREICEQTGLSDRALDALRTYEKNGKALAALNLLLEQQDTVALLSSIQEYVSSQRAFVQSKLLRSILATIASNSDMSVSCFLEDNPICELIFGTLYAGIIYRDPTFAWTCDLKEQLFSEIPHNSAFSQNVQTYTMMEQFSALVRQLSQDHIRQSPQDYRDTLQQCLQGLLDNIDYESSYAKVDTAGNPYEIDYTVTISEIEQMSGKLDALIHDAIDT